MIWIVLLLCFSVTNCNCNETSITEDELIFVQVIFRHGQRTIRKTYPTDPFKDKSHWPEGFGQLTNLGKRQLYDLGQFLRRRYNFLEKGIYSPGKISVISSGYDRTINSANLAVVGMFPPNGQQIWNEQFLMIPVHSLPKSMDYYISAEIACSRYLKARLDYGRSPEIRAIIDAHKELFEYVEKNTGTPIRTIEQFKDIHETLDVENRLNKTIPAWARKIFIPGGIFEYISTFWFKFITGTTELKRLKSGFLLKQLLDRFKNKTLSLLPAEQMMQIYSGHDITISGILDSLDVFELHIPPFASCLMFELYKPTHNNSSHYVQLFYRNSSVEDLTPLNIPHCGMKCPLIRFYDLYSEILVDDLNECIISNV